MKNFYRAVALTVAFTGLAMGQAPPWYVGTGLTSEGPLNYGVESGTGNSYIVTIVKLGGPNSGQQFSFLATHGNTGAATIRIDGISTGTAMALTKSVGGVATALVSGDITTGLPVYCTYDGTRCNITSMLAQAPSGGGSAAELSGAYGSIPSCTVNGQIYRPTSGSLMDRYVCDTSGTPTWRGVVGKDTMPQWDQSAWTWVNQGSSSLDLDQANSNPVKGSILWSGTATTNLAHIRVTNAPANTTTWSIMGRIGFLGVDNGQAGLALHVSGTGASWLCSLFADDGNSNVRFRCVGYPNSDTSSSATFVSGRKNNFAGKWMDVCMTNNSTSNNIEVYIKTEGGIWRQADDNRSKTALGTIDKYGYYVSGGAAGVELQVYGWKEVSGACPSW